MLGIESWFYEDMDLKSHQNGWFFQHQHFREDLSDSIGIPLESNGFFNPKWDGRVRQKPWVILGESNETWKMVDHLEVFLDLTITWKPPKWYVELMEKINNGGYNEGITDRKGGANHNITVIQWDIHSFSKNPAVHHDLHIKIAIRLVF